MERLRILEDAKKLKQLAVAFLHPEKPVEVDATLPARCYFNRPSAPEQENAEESAYRKQILEDTAALKRHAVDYMHPELGVYESDSTVTARCYFNRPSAPEQESMEEAEERRMVLEDSAALKRLAVDYMHPELGVVTSDPTATGRCYFDRPSATRESAKMSQSKEKELQVESKVKTVPVPAPVVKTVGVKTVEMKLDGVIRMSASAVQLYGLDDDHCDDAF